MNATTSLICAASLFAPSLLAAQAAPSPVRDWIKEYGIPIATPEAGHGFRDLQPLKRVIGDSRIVSMGEATHGTREFFQLKHRMLEFLATEMGFTIFAMEANMATAQRINDYVITGKGDPSELMRVFGFPWDSEEVFDMIRWMREFNKSGKGPIQFTGFDMQSTKLPGENVSAFVEKYDPDFRATVSEAIKAAQTARYAAPPSGTLRGSFPVADAAGKKIKLSGYIKTENVSESVVSGYFFRRVRNLFQMSGVAGSCAFSI